MLDGLDLEIPAGRSLAIVGRERRRQDDAGQAARPALRADRRARSPSTASTCASSTRRRGSAGSPRSSRTSSATSCRPRDNVALRRASSCAGDDAPARGRGRAAGARELVDALPTGWDTVAVAPVRRAAPTSPAASGSASRSRGRCSRSQAGAGVLVLDEPTANLDVRAEAEFFDRFLDLTRGLTTIADLAPLLDRAPRRPHRRARATAASSRTARHDELLALGGRYARAVPASRPRASPTTSR